MPSPTHPGPLGPLPEAVIYKDIATMRVAIEKIAEENGYAISGDCRTAIRVSFICTKGGKYNNKNKTNADVPMPPEFKRRKNTWTIKTRCKFRINGKPAPGGGWQLLVSCPDHNHDSVLSNSALPQYRRAAMTTEELEKVKQMYKNGEKPSFILETLRSENKRSVLVMKDIYNLLQSIRQEELRDKTLIE
jgi:hypothetical protein